jgi:hypothetical protein
LYLGLPINCIILGWVNLAMVKILEITLGLDKRGAILVVMGMLVFTAFYTAISGLWGVLVTDLFQFALKMAMVIVLAILAVNAVGGIDALKTKIGALDAASGSGSRLAFFPEYDSIWMPAITLFVYLAVNWWATWYPGAEPGGGGYVAQRIFSAKNEKHGLLATLWFNIAHYALRPWPWILTALASLILYPELVDKESGYIKTGGLSDLPARVHARCVCRRLHVNHRHAVELGRVVCDQRLLSSFHKARRKGQTLRRDFSVGDVVVDDRFGNRHVFHGIDRRSVETVAGDGSWNGNCASAALVLVAHQRVVGSFSDDHRGYRFDLPPGGFALGQRQAERLRLPDARDSIDHHRGLGCSYDGNLARTE